MKTYFTSDTHICHVNMTKAGKDLCGRPFADVDEMNHALLVNINETVGNERLVMLGDNLMGKWAEGLEWASQLTCDEVLWLPGNHDRWSRTNDKQWKPSSSDSKAARDAKNLANRQKYAAELEGAREGFRVLLEDEDWEFRRSWNFCQLSDEWEGNPLDRAQFSHYPHEGESWGGREDRYKELRPVAATPVVCGHVHTSWAERGNQFNAGVDVRNYAPVSEDEIAKWMETLDG